MKVLAFVEAWEGRVSSQTRAKLLLPKAALLIRQGHREAASRPIRQALEACSTDDLGLSVMAVLLSSLWFGAVWLQKQFREWRGTPPS